MHRPLDRVCHDCGDDGLFGHHSIVLSFDLFLAVTDLRLAG